MCFLLTVPLCRAEWEVRVISVLYMEIVVGVAYPIQQWQTAQSSTDPELSTVWVTYGLGWVGLGRYFSVFDRFGWVGSTIAKVLKFVRITLMHLKDG